MLDEENEIVTARDCKRLGYCISGCLKMCDKHNVDRRDFISNGVSIAKLRELNEPVAQKLIEDILSERS